MLSALCSDAGIKCDQDEEGPHPPEADILI